MNDYLTNLHSIEERLKSGKKMAAFFYDKETDRVKPLLALAKKKNVPIKKVSREELKSIGAFHAALAIPLEDVRGGAAWFKKKLMKLDELDNALVIALDGITDPHNMGAILRSACQFGANLVIYPERRSAQGDTDTVARTSAGAAELVSHGFVVNLSSALKELKESGFWIYGTDMSGTSMQQTVFNKKSVLVLGSEGKGLNSLTKKNCDHIMSIPTTGRIDSLNVSVAAGIAMYSFYIADK